MKCICLRKCQALSEDTIMLFAPGQVVEFDECPRNFEEIEAEDFEVDFAEAGKEELMAAKWKYAEVVAAAKSLYKFDLGKMGERSKEEVVDKFLDVRYRFVDPNAVG